MRLSGSEPTYPVSALCGELKELLRTAYSSVWVAGEVQRVHRSQRGHLYFELIEKGDGDRIVAKLDCVLWARQAARVERVLEASGQALAEGTEVRCRAGFDFWPPGGRLQLVVQEVDPAFALGKLEQRRRETLEFLQARGLMETNAALSLARVPLNLGLVTSEGSAAYHDFLSRLEESGYGFRVLFVHSSVQGMEAETQLVSALELLRGTGIDAAVVVRGGGSRSDLAAFDGRAVAEAVALAPFPVITGLGHEIDLSIADQVAHTALKTPTRAAEYLIERVGEADAEVALGTQRLVRVGADALRRARERLTRADAELRLARGHLIAVGARVDEAGRLLVRLARHRLEAAKRRARDHRRALAAQAPRRLERVRSRAPEAARRLVRAAESRLATHRAELDGTARLLQELGPERILSRGFSITRGEDGRLLRAPGEAAARERIETRLAEGSLWSRVEEPS